MEDVQAIDVDVTRDTAGPAAAMVSVMGHGATRLRVSRRASSIKNVSPQAIVAIDGSAPVPALTDATETVETWQRLRITYSNFI